MARTSCCGDSRDSAWGKAARALWRVIFTCRARWVSCSKWVAVFHIDRRPFSREFCVISGYIPVFRNIPIAILGETIPHMPRSSAMMGVPGWGSRSHYWKVMVLTLPSWGLFQFIAGALLSASLLAGGAICILLIYRGPPITKWR